MCVACSLSMQKVKPKDEIVHGVERWLTKPFSSAGFLFPCHCHVHLCRNAAGCRVRIGLWWQRRNAGREAERNYDDLVCRNSGGGLQCDSTGERRKWQRIRLDGELRLVAERDCAFQ